MEEKEKRAWFIYREGESADNIGYYKFRGGLQESETVG
jgi:hypothetical protein